MSDLAPPKKQRGAAGLAFVLCAIAGGIGLGLDFLRQTPAFAWIGERPGSRAAIGVAAAILVVGVAQALRAALGKRGAAAD